MLPVHTTAAVATMCQSDVQGALGQPHTRTPLGFLFVQYKLPNISELLSAYATIPSGKIERSTGAAVRAWKESSG